MALCVDVAALTEEEGDQVRITYSFHIKIVMITLLKMISVHDKKKQEDIWHAIP